MVGKAIVYARVSTDDQAERGFSLSAQVDAGCKYAEVHGFSVAYKLQDEGVSGALAFKERPAGSEALGLLRTGKADVLIVQNVDRLSRDIIDLMKTVRELLQKGIAIYSLDIGQVTSEYDIMLVIRGWQSTDERSKFRGRSMTGKRSKLVLGMIVANGRPAYGYDYLRDEEKRVINLTPNEEQAAIVRMIFRLYTTGDEDGGPYTTYSIAKRLSESGITTPAPNTSRRKRPAHIWSACTISRILKSPLYKGEYRYTFDHEEEFIIPVPPLVDEVTWEQAQVQRERNSRKSARNAKHDYLLTGLVKCECGRGMFGRTTSQKSAKTRDYRYYYCGSMVAHYDFEQIDRCKTGNIDADRLETAVWNAILDIVTNRSEFEAKLRQAQALELDEQEPKREELHAVEAMMAEAESEAVQLGSALSRAGKVVGKVLEDKMAALDERYERLEARRNELVEGLKSRRLSDEAIDEILTFAADVARGIQHADNATKRHTLDVFDVQIVVKDRVPVLEYKLPTPTSIELQSCSPRRR